MTPDQGLSRTWRVKGVDEPTWVAERGGKLPLSAASVPPDAFARSLDGYGKTIAPYVKTQ